MYKSFGTKRSARCCFGQSFNNRMTSFADHQFVAMEKSGPGVAEPLGGAGKSSVRTSSSAITDARFDEFDTLRRQSGADFLKQALFDFENAFFGGQDLLFVFLQLRSRIAFGPNERLLPVIVVGTRCDSTCEISM